MSMRSDTRQWLIYDDETTGALVRGLEVACMSMAGQTLARSSHVAVRAIGNLALRIAATRAQEMWDKGGPTQAVMDNLARVTNGLAGTRPWDDDVEKAADELHAAAFHLDSKVRGAGFKGPGDYRTAVRGD